MDGGMVINRYPEQDIQQSQRHAQQQSRKWARSSLSTPLSHTKHTFESRLGSANAFYDEMTRTAVAKRYVAGIHWGLLREWGLPLDGRPGTATEGGRRPRGGLLTMASSWLTYYHQSGQYRASNHGQLSTAVRFVRIERSILALIRVNQRHSCLGVHHLFLVVC